MNAVNAGISGLEPDEIEALLPWHAAGTLNARDARRVNEALSRDPQLARQFAVIREELGETIHLNESLGAPSARAMQKLLATIDAEPARRASPVGWSARLADFVSTLSPRTLAWSAVAGAVALLLQAGVIGTVLVKERSSAFETASHPGAATMARAAGPVALVQFSPDARVGDITALLNAYNASIVEGGKAGTFRLQFGDKPLPKSEADALIARLQSEKIVSFVAAAQ